MRHQIKEGSTHSMAAVCCEPVTVSETPSCIVKDCFKPTLHVHKYSFHEEFKKDKSKNFLINYSTFATPQLRAKSPGNAVAADTVL